jgi:hypothetical protein
VVAVKVLARLRVNGESIENDDDKAAELRGKQPKVVVKVATQRLKPLRGGESVLDAVKVLRTVKVAPQRGKSRCDG